MRSGAGDAQNESRCESAVPRAACSAGADTGNPDLFAADVLAARGKLVAADHLAADRLCHLLRLRPQAQRHEALPGARDQQARHLAGRVTCYRCRPNRRGSSRSQTLAFPPYRKAAGAEALAAFSTPHISAQTRTLTLAARRQ